MNVQTEQLRQYLGPVTNTDIWASFRVRADDVYVVTPPKCGTTWTLHIAMMLILGRAEAEAGTRDNAPWLDMALRDRPAMAAMLDGLDRRRCIKSHTPMDGIAYGAEPTYLAVYRHPVDAFFSFRSHVHNMKDGSIFADVVPDDLAAAFQRFLSAPVTDTGTDDFSLAAIVHHYQQAKARQSNGNVHFLHYADLTRDLAGQVARLNDLLGTGVAPDTLREIVQANTFASARRTAEASAGRFSDASPFKDHAQFYASGTSNKWQGRLSDADIAAYTDRLNASLPAEDVAWLNWGDPGTAAQGQADPSLPDRP
ncbi:hypothetical protein ACMU_06690 [Actibacterium mucosum KCTC 23349]|uniref:Sulfotransferase domain-containing protein n=1 Tax=Actibacterium mucosum KCTC 23349 TaxID=1454373 RepID=A0A037ZJK8_9RHOB|nr:sulfotransferase domain-containing protein [Actibacterium mucosum]KAJ56625.1 hypothetical protein ACMU_06690 [Actibacterium mucosum KCTC 23349]